MKRILVLILCVALALTAVSAQALSIAKIVGRWYFVSIDGNGLGSDNYVEFNRNKSVTLVINGAAVDTSGYEWTFADDTVSIGKAGSSLTEYRLDATETELTLSSDKLNVLSNDTRYHDYSLAREAVTYYTPAIVPAETEDRFFGDYVLYLALANGQYMPMSSDANGFEIAEYVATVFSEGREPVEYLTDFVEGRLIVYADVETYISTTADPDVLVAYTDSNIGKGLGSAAYLRRRSARQPEITPAAPVTTPEPAPQPANPQFPSLINRPVATPAPTAPTPEPAVPEPTVQPAGPSFPSMINRPVFTPAPAEDPSAAGDTVEAYYGSYIVYQDVLANGRVLDMTSRGLRAAIDADGVHAVVYGQSATVPYTFENGVMTADLTPVSPDYGFATAALADNGDLIVTLADASGYVGETLYLKPEN